MARQITALLRALQDKGYVEINPESSSVTRNKILYVENVGIDPITINIGGVTGSIGAEQSSADYNPNAVPVNGAINNLVLGGSDNTPQYIGTIEYLQRILKVELVGADKTALQYRDEQFYNGSYWVNQQRQVPMIYLDHSLNPGKDYTLRVSLPRIPTGARVVGRVLSESYKWDALQPTATFYNIDVTLTAGNLLAGYVDIEISDNAISMTNPNNNLGILSKKDNFDALYEGNHIRHTVTLRLELDSGGLLKSDDFIYECIVKLPRPITYQLTSGTTANIVTLNSEPYQLAGNIRISTPAAELVGVATGFIGTHTHDGVGINRGKRYIEFDASLMNNNFIGLLQPIKEADGSYSYKPMFGFKGKYKLVIEGEEVPSQQGGVTYTDGARLKLAVDFETGKVFFGVNTAWYDLDDFNSNGTPHENFANADYAQMSPSPDFLGMPPLTYGVLYDKDEMQTMRYKFYPINTQYTPPMDYQPFL